ncbi:sulfatase-like hydrolase/transferase [Hungatella hathewayi]|nr:sulfatase-like hydrolase/transferase [Hungatella hathewayi]
MKREAGIQGYGKMKETGKWLARIGVLSIAIHMMIESIGRKSVWMMISYIESSPLVFLLNTLIIALPFALLFLTRRKCFVMAIVSILWLTAGVVNGFLLTFRTTPFTAADFRLVKYGLNMITTYMTWPQIILAVGGCVLALFGCVVIWKKAPRTEGKVSFVKAVPLVAVFAALVLGCTAAAMETELVAVRFGNIGQAFKDYGFPYCFANSLFNTGISKPKTYDSETVAMIEEELVPENTYRLSENKTPNIIMIQLESFFDPLVYRNYSFEYDPIPYFRYLKKRYPSGYLKVPSVGAGTANTEFECITGMNLDFFGPGEYPYKTILQKTVCESMAFDMKELGYTSHAIHNNEGTFYDRHKVFSQLGFDTFTPIEYMYDIKRNPTGWCEDEILVDEIVKTLDSTRKQDFIYAISVQGHGAYPNFEYYCQQIHEMDNFVKRLTYTLRARKEPTVVVMYGDHLPGFPWEEGDMKNHSLFQTPYVVWNNLDLEPVKRNVESYQLAAYVLDMLDIHEGTMMRYHQKYLDDKTADKEQYLEGMKVLEYDMLYGDQEIYGGEMPYEATDLQMGIHPIVVEKMVYQEPNLLLYGENFNEFSKVYFNDKAVDTMYAGRSNLLIVRDIPEKKLEDVVVSVKQVGKDKVPLGDAVMEAEEIR